MLENAYVFENVCELYCAVLQTIESTHDIENLSDPIGISSQNCCSSLYMSTLVICPNYSSSHIRADSFDLSAIAHQIDREGYHVQQ